MKTLCTWLLQYFSTYNYIIMKLCRYKKFAKVKIKFTLFKNVESRNTLETDPACFFPRFSLPFIYNVSDTALSQRPFIKSVFQNVARNQSWKELSFLLFFTKLTAGAVAWRKIFLHNWVIGFIYLVCRQNLSRNAKRPVLWLYFTSSSDQLLSKATLLFVYRNVSNWERTVFRVQIKIECSRDKSWIIFIKKVSDLTL